MSRLTDAQQDAVSAQVNGAIEGRRPRTDPQTWYAIHQGLTGGNADERQRWASKNLVPFMGRLSAEDLAALETLQAAVRGNDGGAEQSRLQVITPMANDALRSAGIDPMPRPDALPDSDAAQAAKFHRALQDDLSAFESRGRKPTEPEAYDIVNGLKDTGIRSGWLKVSDPGASPAVTRISRRPTTPSTRTARSSDQNADRKARRITAGQAGRRARGHQRVLGSVAGNDAVAVGRPDQRARRQGRLRESWPAREGLERVQAHPPRSAVWRSGHAGRDGRGQVEGCPRSGGEGRARRIPQSNGAGVAAAGQQGARNTYASRHRGHLPIHNGSAFGGCYPLGRLLRENPGEIAKAIGIESVPALTVGLIAMAALGPVGGAVTLTGTSGLDGYAKGLLGALASAGVDISDADALTRAFQDKALMERVRKDATTVGAIEGGATALLSMAGPIAKAAKTAGLRIVEGVDASTLVRAHSLGGSSSIRRVEKLAANMRTNGYVGDPIEVIESDGRMIIVNGHHRTAAARRTGTPVNVKIVGPDFFPTSPGGWQSIDEVVSASKTAGPNRLNRPGRR